MLSGQRERGTRALRQTGCIHIWKILSSGPLPRWTFMLRFGPWTPSAEGCDVRSQARGLY